MSNTSNGPANKGSKYMMQILASPLVRDLASTVLNDKLKWLSPLSEDDYNEYSLNQGTILEALGISTKDKDDLFNFWPKKQPQWDGIALGSSGTLYLFEAKSYPAEMESGCSASSKHSIEKITKALKAIADVYGGDFKEEIWLI